MAFYMKGAPGPIQLPGVGTLLVPDTGVACVASKREAVALYKAGFQQVSQKEWREAKPIVVEPVAEVEDELSEADLQEVASAAQAGAEEDTSFILDEVPDAIEDIVGAPAGPARRPKTPRPAAQA